MISRASTVTATTDQVSADMSGAAVILQLKDGIYYQLNEVGAQIWNLITQQPRKVDELVQTIVKEYDIDEARCTTDVLALIEDMKQRGLVEIS